MNWDCWGFIDGTEKIHDDSANYKEKRDYNFRRDRAFSFIYLNVSLDLRPLLAEMTDAKTAWDILQPKYRRKTTAIIISLLHKFFVSRYELGVRIGLFAARLRTNVKQ